MQLRNARDHNATGLHVRTKLRECATTSYVIEARLHADDVSLTNQV